MKNEMNLTMLTDFYEFTMMNGFFAEEYKDKIAMFIQDCQEIALRKVKLSSK